MNGSSTDTIRVFIAARPSAATREELVRVQNELKKSLSLSELGSEVSRAPSTFSGRIKWTDPSTFHITILFLGDITCGQVPAILEKINSVGRVTSPGGCALSGSGLFKKSGALWVGIDASPELLNLQAAVADALERDPGRFHAHFTVGRVKKGRPDPTFFQTLEKTNIDPVSFDIKELELVRSELLPAGARHTVLSRIPLSSRP